MRKLYLLIFISVFFLSACVHTRNFNVRLQKSIRKDSILRSAHYGIAVWDTDKNKFLIRHQSDHYFVPASNVKIATLYAALKYLPDSLPSFDYYQSQDTLFIFPKGDPTLLDGDFRNHPALGFLKRQAKPIVILPVKWETEIYGKGWAWDDYHRTYMPEKSLIPIPQKDTGKHTPGGQIVFPSVKDMYDRVAGIVSDSLSLPVKVSFSEKIPQKGLQTYYAISRDSVCKKMMFRSDNLIAEQLLLMISERLLGIMNEEKVIEKILSDTVLHFPQKPVWVDGSGLSRHNLFTPEDIVYLLQKTENEFSTEHMKQIFPTGNEGTLKGYYDDKAGIIYAKTGTLSGQLSLSGYLQTKKNKSLIFSFMINNHTGKISDLRKSVAEYIDWIWRSY